MGRLKYIDNADYSRGESPQSIDSLIAEIKEIAGIDEEAGEIYDALHTAILREIKTTELAITVIMPDLIGLMERTPKKAMLVMRLLANPYASYSDLGYEMGYSKQRVAVILHDIGKRYRWLSTLLKLHNGGI